MKRTLRVPRRQAAKDRRLAFEIRRGVTASVALMSGHPKREAHVRSARRNVDALIKAGAR